MAVIIRINSLGHFNFFFFLHVMVDLASMYYTRSLVNFMHFFSSGSNLMVKNPPCGLLNNEIYLVGEGETHPHLRTIFANMYSLCAKSDSQWDIFNYIHGFVCISCEMDFAPLIMCICRSYDLSLKMIL